ncbi:LuxR C-terminal-related transcriptional regulator [Brevibacillus porteri]|uniref:Transcriptional regulator n=1 Tax=Brevibacillus porteri TaxID=2126350 RepID=A0ABX5FID0_9BACL|nr:LuxR C-terminal-related transcriptional regulator [Brevibacillus porteri]MED1801258.1 LuxR C-terminal-related transcriptional regulator [Brevibacillus porteri]MED2129887.1 LuxR C-terminal-related transcriptional regulator [Brevibacillus porteri]MED2746816.1 LuxR C-terminal-related transcriptional regulator [Brevibacillus porteri]MED2815966.1 LuxR C-terminal-related transcriptional regulator [Brevibacillus porteri]MED2895783.1 LuxR C-terminal-related transcriptional regulator [Brevibacillus 
MDLLTYSPLIATKLHVPKYGSDLLLRHQILKEIDDAGAARLILVCAPAGFGKTTAVSQWTQNSGKPTGWISLDESDNDPVRFWRYFARAIDRAQEGLGKEASSVLHPQYTASAEQLMSVLLEEIAGFERDFYLVLDDYHLIKEPSIHEGLQTLIQHASLYMHVVLITREEPPFALHRLRVRKQLKQLGSDTLRFNEEECRRLFHEQLGLSLSEQDIGMLSKRTEGWVAGLQLAALSMQGKPEASKVIHQFSGNDKYVGEYLSEEVLKRLPEKVQKFLLKTSILPRLTGDLCAAVTGEPDAHDILRMLERTNSFVIALDGVNEWYRYHHLFAELLLSHVRKTYNELLPALHISASCWFESHGWIMEATEHAFLGKDWTRASRLIVAHAPWMLKQYENITLRRWMKYFEKSWLECNPELCIAFAWLHAVSNEIDQAEILLQLADEATRTNHGSFDDCRVEICVLRGYIEVMRGSVDLSLKYMEESVQMKPKFSRYFIVGIELNSDEPYVLRSRVALSGYLSNVNEYYPKLRAIWKHSGLGILAYGSIVMAELYYEKNDFEQLKYFVPRAIQLGTISLNFGVLVPVYLTLARWRKAERRHEEMWLAMEEITLLCRQHDAPPHWMSFVETFRVRLWIEENRREEIEKWAEPYRKMNVDIVASRHEFERMTLARVYIYLKNDSAAIMLLTSLKHEAEIKDRLGSRIEAFLLLSQAYMVQKQHHEATACMRMAVTLAAPEGYVRTFLDEGPGVAKMLYSLYKSKNVSKQEMAYLSMLLKSVEKEFPTLDIQIRVSPALEKLTERESEVLALIGEGLSNSEIADKLHLTLGTVKGHVHQVFSKLQVKNRAQAIVRLRESEIDH